MDASVALGSIATVDGAVLFGVISAALSCKSCACTAGDTPSISGNRKLIIDLNGLDLFASLTIRTLKVDWASAGDPLAFAMRLHETGQNAADVLSGVNYWVNWPSGDLGNCVKIAPLMELRVSRSECLAVEKFENAN